MSRMKARAFRCKDELWEAAQDAARWRGEPSLSAVITRYLVQYVRATNKKRQEEGETDT